MPDGRRRAAAPGRAPWIDAIIARDRRRPPHLRDQGRARHDDEPQRRRLPRRGGPRSTAHEIVQRLKEEAKTAYIDDRGTVFNQDVLGAIELGYMLDCAECDRRRRDRAQGVARRAVPHRLPRAQRRGVAQAHRPHRATGTTTPHVSLLAGDDHPVAARGEQVLDGRGPQGPRSSRCASAATTPSPARRRTGTSTPSSSSRTARCSRASCRPRRASTARSASAARAAPRSAARAACASTASPAWPATRTSTRRWRPPRDGVIEVEPMGNMPVHQGPDRRHGRGPLEEDPARHAVAHQQGADPRARVHRRRASRWSTSRSRWPASSAAPASRTACRWRSTRCSSARPRWPRPTASSATRATPQQYERLKDLAEDPHGIYDCTHCFKCIEACPKGVAPMSQIMRLRRRAGNDHHIVDRNNGHRHEAAFVTLIKRQRPAARGRAAAALLRRRLVVRQVRTRRPALELLDSLPVDHQGAAAPQGHAEGRAEAAQARQGRPQGDPADLRDGRGPRRALRAEPLHHRLRRGRRRRRRARDARRRRRGPARHRARGVARPMKVAYWPGCVSRGFTPELHGSMAKVAPLLDIELVELDRACCTRRRRHRRAQPGARRHAQRAHVRARPAGRGRRADDEHLLDLPGRADRVPGAPRRQRRVPRARQRDARRARACTTRRA